MKRSLIQQFLLYRYRYIVGYALYSLLLIALLTVGLTSVPHGITEQEMASASQSAISSINGLLFESALDAPYKLMQKLSLWAFDLTPFAIKLPSVVLALLSGIALALMLRRWFRVNVAVLSGILIATSTPFLVLGRTGTSAIMTIFWLSIILLAATKMLHNKRHTYLWKVLCFVSAALSLYTPLMVYPLIALATAGLLHPHVRFILRRISPLKFSLAIGLSLLLLAPLAWSIIQNPAIALTLLGIPQDLPSWSQLLTNTKEVALAFFGLSAVSSGVTVLPLFGAASLAIIILGLLKTVVDGFSARSYMIVIWLALVTPIVILNPDTIMVYFMPIVLLIAIGIETLIREWYRLFPKNPYARVAALIPLTILLVSISASNIGRYFYGYIYDPQPGVFSQELVATRDTLQKAALKDKPVQLVVPQDDVRFYDLLRRDFKDVSVSSIPESGKATIITQTRFSSLAAEQQQQLTTPYRLVTTGAAEDGLLLRVYVDN